MLVRRRPRFLMRHRVACFFPTPPEKFRQEGFAGVFQDDDDGEYRPAARHEPADHTDAAPYRTGLERRAGPFWWTARRRRFEGESRGRVHHAWLLTTACCDARGKEKPTSSPPKGTLQSRPKKASMEYDESPCQKGIKRNFFWSAVCGLRSAVWIRSAV